MFPRNCRPGAILLLEVSFEIFFATSRVQVIVNRNGFQCPLMCNPAEFFVDVLSKNTIVGEETKYERKWFPSLLMKQSCEDKINEIEHKEMDLLVW